MANTLQSQEIFIQGRIVNADDSTGVSYATIGIEQKTFGNVANSEGYFNYRFDPKGQLVASC
jgi:hypothetical protein